MEQINQAGEPLTNVSDTDLRARIDALRGRIRAGALPDDVLIEGFALGREAAARVLGLRPFDVQILAGIALFEGNLVEMKTGEGKTLAAVLPASLLAMKGKGVHILTFNDYLARRDARWMKPLYDFMGVSVGFVQENHAVDQRKAAYQAGVTYATAREAGFDFLRMNLVRSPEKHVHRGFHFALIDEADSILIDEARMPLVIAGERSVSKTDPYRVARIIEVLEPEQDWETDDHLRNVQLTDRGIDRVEAALVCGRLYDEANERLLAEVNLALHARVLLQRDVDYIVRDRRIEIVDEFTGRVMDDRRWPDGLQAALAAREGLEIQPGGRILGSVTIQQFLKVYEQLAGMTATAESAAGEFADVYGLQVVRIPTNRPCVRQDLPAHIYTHKEAKYEALTRKIASCHRSGRPVLVGTGSVAESELIARRLEQIDIPCEVLNAKNDEAEARIVTKAGEPGAVTISTNMAGRGTDIKLGGVNEARRNEVVERGGLLVLGTNLHESRRIDDQLRGRSGRQGDPGSSQFYLSLEDDLMVRFGIDALIPERIRPAHCSDSLNLPGVRREVERIQRIAEGQNTEIRKTLYRYSVLLNQQRKKLYDWRAQVLDRDPDQSLFMEKRPEAYELAVKQVGESAVSEAERAITLHHIDACWSNHLAHVAQVRESIHLVGLGGMHPLNEFHKVLAEAFWKLLMDIEERIVEDLARLQITKGRIVLDDKVVQGPSATWTYLINDQVSTDLQNMLFGHGSTAIAAGAVLMTWPLLLAWGIWRRWKNRRLIP